MLSVKQGKLPEESLLDFYTEKGHTDCYFTDVNYHLSFDQFVTAFYTTRLFRLERLILKLLVNKPSSDQQITELLEGKSNLFAAWSMEKRVHNQLLMCDFQKRTRSWFQIKSIDNSITRLYFGSAVVERTKGVKVNKPNLGVVFKAMLGFHKLYSILLLYSAKKRLIRSLSKNIKES
ncbi:MAG: hypothetical protein COA74_10845 [Gammaproteobacteria bacterium]|nr:MAG: hypothetical protein COA74_10845 [Gammaproteobacteria bacterium]